MWPGTDLLGTPLQRDPKLGTRALLNDKEYAQKEARAKLVGDDAQDLPGVNIGSPIWWLEHGKPTRQASLIVEPPDGRIPPLTPEAIKLGEARDAKFHLTYGVERKVHGSNDSWIDDVLALVEPYESNLYDRCISRGVIGSILPGEPGGYNLGNQIMQAPGLVVIRYEMIHETRVIPVDGRPHVGSGVRTYMGDPRGHWEGNTLVVETTNFLGGKLGLLSHGGGTPYSDRLGSYRTLHARCRKYAELRGASSTTPKPIRNPGKSPSRCIETRITRWSSTPVTKGTTLWKIFFAGPMPSRQPRRARGKQPSETIRRVARWWPRPFAPPFFLLRYR